MSIERTIDQYRETKAATRWLDVKDRLPEKDGNYLVIDSHGSQFVAGFYTDEEVFQLNHDFFDAGDVTHWMPLPAPPA